MDQDPTKDPKRLCSKCGEECGHLIYDHRESPYCENCYFDLMMPRRRKTHWQYLSSIKSEYILDR